MDPYAPRGALDQLEAALGVLIEGTVTVAYHAEFAGKITEIAREYNRADHEFRQPARPSNVEEQLTRVAVAARNLLAELNSISRPAAMFISGDLQRRTMFGDPDIVALRQLISRYGLPHAFDRDPQIELDDILDSETWQARVADGSEPLDWDVALAAFADFFKFRAQEFRDAQGDRADLGGHRNVLSDAIGHPKHHLTLACWDLLSKVDGEDPGAIKGAPEGRLHSLAKAVWAYATGMDPEAKESRVGLEPYAKTVARIMAASMEWLLESREAARGGYDLPPDHYERRARIDTALITGRWP